MSNGQEAVATLQVAAAHTGVSPIVFPEAKAEIFASLFLGAAGQALGTVQQGGDPQEILRFVHLLMPAASAHIERLKNDPEKKPLYQHLNKLLAQTGAVTDKLTKHLQDNPPPKQNGNGQMQMPPPSPEVLQKMANDNAIAEQKRNQQHANWAQRFQQRDVQGRQAHQNQLRQSEVQAAATDIATAAQLRSNRLRSLSE
jgi:hypothetical protein